jgi:hypothetical protein
VHDDVPASETPAGKPSWPCPVLPSATATLVVCIVCDADDSGTTPLQLLSSPNSYFRIPILIE